MPSLASKLQLLKTDNVAQKRKAGPTICHKLTPSGDMYALRRNGYPVLIIFPFRTLKRLRKTLKTAPGLYKKSLYKNLFSHYS